ncbi:hypothetical protein [Halobellus rarus]|uniref:Uncharacterized protein n=1 Tax=Halobellus rarus TaxID=1126237 RepID=A0ABD6CSG6_9EURY|nr:hypothetical protein [Halobellus rarus]
MAPGFGSSALRSPNVWIGGAAVSDLLARLPEDVLVPLVSLLGGTVGPESVAAATTWLLFATVFYTFTPLVYTYLDWLQSEARGFRAVFTASAVSAGLLFEYVEGVRLTAGIAVLMIASAAAMLWYLSRVRGWSLFDPEGNGVEVLQLVSPHRDVSEELRADFAREGLVGVAGRVAYLAAVGILLTFPVFLSGVISQLFVYAYPLPDLLFLGWAVVAAVSPRLTIGPSRGQVLDVEFDLERYLLDSLENVSRSVQGLFLTTFVVLGAFVATGYLFFAVTLGSQMARPSLALLGGSILELGLDAWVTVWGLSGLVAMLGFAGTFFLWLWVRELQRLPHFLDAWEGRETTEGAPIARPAGFVALPLFAVLASAAYVFAVSAPGTSPVEYAFALCWPLVLGLGWWVANRSREPQPLTHENLWIAVGLYVETVSVWFLSRAITVATASGSPSVGAIFAALNLPVVLGFITAFPTLLPYVSRYEDRDVEGRSYALVWFLIAVAVLAALTSQIATNPVRFQLRLLAGAASLGSVALALVRRHDL